MVYNGKVYLSDILNIKCRIRGILLFYVKDKLKGQILFNDKLRVWTLLKQLSTTQYAQGSTLQELIDYIILRCDYDRNDIVYELK